tara:strand:- start:84 stop:560 length:477 start_codon:yes stop_codon:yes gene_type:complete
MAFKMKGGKDPMKKNFGSALKSNKFLGELAAAREKGDKTFNVGGKTFDVKGSAQPKLKDNAPMMRMDNSAMKAMGKPAPVKMSHPMKQDDDLDTYVEPGSAKDLATQPDYNKPAEKFVPDDTFTMSKERKDLEDKLRNKLITSDQYNKAISDLQKRQS